MRALSFVLVAAACPPDARAAGGHHAVDDAAILEPGQCLIETWFDRARSENLRALHFGPACRLGAVELALNADRLEFRDRLSTLTVYIYSPQIKWASAVTERVDVGVVLTANYQNRSPHRIGYALVLPFSWQASESIAVHLNAGRDFHNAPTRRVRALHSNGRRSLPRRSSPNAIETVIAPCGGSARVTCSILHSTSISATHGHWDLWRRGGGRSG